MNRFTISSAGDLDYVWMEFFLTGADEPVLNIFDVLEWKDLIGKKLLEWWSNPASGCTLTKKYRWRKARRAMNGSSIFGGILRKAGEIDPEFDLDTWCLDYNSFYGYSAERIGTIRDSLPFRLSNDDVKYIATKDAARWPSEKLSWTILGSSKLVGPKGNFGFIWSTVLQKARYFIGFYTLRCNTPGNCPPKTNQHYSERFLVAIVRTE